MKPHLFTAGFLFCGLGAGARGFLEAAARLDKDSARFKSVGGIDIDKEACKDFEYLTGSKAVVADLSKLSVAELRSHWGDVAPDCVFLSPPCKGFSGLLSQEASETEHYQNLNQLVLQSAFLVCEAWETPPSLIVIENVPRIQTRGKELLAKVRQLLSRYGYVFDEATHDCGEVGGLAQHRRRYLLVARLPKQVPCYIYKPPKQRVKACGEVLEKLPLPEDPNAGPLHKLPEINWLNWVRLALIPAGGDWRDLPGGPTELKKTKENAKSFGERPGLFGVNDWNEPAPTVTGSAAVSSGNMPAAISDPRQFGFKTNYGVADWSEPLGTITGAAKTSSGTFSIADPRLSKEAFGHVNKVTPWDEPTGTVTHSPAPSSGAIAVADPRLSTPLQEGQERRAVWAKYKVAKWEEPVGTVAGPGTNGEFGVADPRLGLPSQDGNPNRHHNKYKVVAWEEPTPTVIGATRPGSGALNVADPRLTCKPRKGTYGVLSWEEAARTIVGAAGVDNGRFAVADPRKAPDFIPIIIAKDGTWHRPLTTLELAALQGLPSAIDGKPLQLAGKSSARHRERIGNAVPVGAARAIAETLLTALLAARLGTWTLGSTGIWVRKKGRSKKSQHEELRGAV